MELGAVDIAAAHRAGDRDAVLAGGKGRSSAVFGVVAVHVVDVLAVFHVLEQRVVLASGHDVQRVPADVRHF